MSHGQCLAFVGAMALFGCQVDGQPALDATVDQAIVDGETSLSSDDAVVSIISPSQLCSGTLVASNLVLTARHCVTKRATNAVDCSNDAEARSENARIVSDYAPNQLEIRLGAAYSLTPAAYGEQIVSSDSDSVCWSDIALIRLDRKLESVPIVPLRLTRPTEIGELMAIVGYGQSPSSSLPEGTTNVQRKRRNHLPVIDIGPNRFDPVGGMAPLGKFLLGNGICNGDAGGPAMVEATGALAGVASIVGTANCVESTSNQYELLAEHVDLVSRAFDEANASLWLENEAAPRSTTPRTSHGCSVSTSRGTAPDAVPTISRWIVLLVALFRCLRARRPYSERNSECALTG